MTGAGSGIGRAVSVKLQSAGYSVVLAGRRAEKLIEAAGDAKAGGGEMLAVPTDIGQPDGTRLAEPRMDVRHVADAVLYMANLPLDANVQFLTVMATKMPFVGRG